ncbi:MAG: TIGR03545 family protein [Planctomycetaceae bacterium]|nr:TIGR03545 family protein [Planctomycetaceae bacterium]
MSSQEVHMRWSYLIPRLVLVGLIWAFFAFGFDPLVRYSAVQSIQAVTGARADVPMVTSGFFPPRLTVESVALASHSKPGTNLVAFDSMTLRLAGDPLLRRCFVVEEASLTGVRFGTSRDDNGQLEYQPEPEDSEPSWLAERMRDLGDEWLEQFTASAKAELDPNNLESYRIGNEIYLKWDERFEQMNVQLSQKQEQVRVVKAQLDAAKKAQTVQQIEIYLQLAQQADLLLREVRQLRTQYQNIFPEVQQDFVRLDQARRNDQEQIVRRIRLLKPDSRRITESLLGEHVYGQVQQVLSWLELIRNYQHDLQQPPPPERSRGRDFEFPLLNPTPRVLCRKMLINGELMLSHVPTPFEAVLTDVTSNPQMLGRPALLRMTTQGEMPMEVVVQHDATTAVAVTDFGADFTDPKSHHIAAGKEDGDHLIASLGNMHWMARMRLCEGRIDGRISVASQFSQPHFTAASKAATVLAGFTQQTLDEISGVNATVTVTGPVRHPQVELTSDLGEQIAGGFQTAFTSFAPQARALLTAKVDEFVDQQREGLSVKFGGRYDKLLADHDSIISSLNEVQQLVAAVKSGHVDPKQVVRTVSNTGVLSDREQKKVNKVMTETDKVMDGLKDPNKALDLALPSIRKKLFK